MFGDLTQGGQVHLTGRALAEEHVVLIQPDSPLLPGTDLDVREVALGHLVPHLDVLGGHDDDGGAREGFVDVGVAAVIQQADRGVETVTNSPGLVRKLLLGRLGLQVVRGLGYTVGVELHQLKQVDQHHQTITHI